jgi:hypothetical protein
VHATKCSVQRMVRQILGAVSQLEKAQLVVVSERVVHPG